MENGLEGARLPTWRQAIPCHSDLERKDKEHDLDGDNASGESNPLASFAFLLQLGLRALLCRLAFA